MKLEGYDHLFGGGEGGDVELGLRVSNYAFVCATLSKMYVKSSYTLKFG